VPSEHFFSLFLSKKPGSFSPVRFYFSQFISIAFRPETRWKKALEFVRNVRQITWLILWRRGPPLIIAKVNSTDGASIRVSRMRQQKFSSALHFGYALHRHHDRSKRS